MPRTRCWCARRAGFHGRFLLDEDVLRDAGVTDFSRYAVDPVADRRCPTCSSERSPMKYLHTMIRVRDLDATLRFFCEGLGLRETRRMDNEAGKYTLVFLAADETPDAEIELTYNWGSDEDYGSARNFGHLAFRVADIYATCARLQSMGYTINRPPRDGHMAFVRSPDQISIELLQDGHLPPQEPWASMPNTGAW